MNTSPDVNLWPTPAHASDYLRRADSIPHRVEGEATLLEFLPAEANRILDLGSGGGRLLALVKSARPRAQFVALDFSPPMLEALRKLFVADSSVTIVAHDFENELPPMDRFEDEDPSNELLDLETQLAWLREIGFVDVDCHWKWRELASFVGVKESSSSFTA
jgi:SAM-dependent methyltransferase